MEEIEKQYNVNIIGRNLCSNCLSPLINGLKKANNKNLLKKKLNLIIGPQKASKIKIDNDLIIVGNCLKHLEKKGLFVAGCPPISSDLIEAIKKL